MVTERFKSYYVGNIPDGATVNEIWKKFEGYGKVVDVYLAHKKERSGGRFGFVRFDGVKDAKSLEQSFGKIFLGHNSLNINIARFHRKPVIPIDQRNSNNPINHQTSHYSPPPPQPPASAWGFRGLKTFASVVTGAQFCTNNNLNPVKICISPDLDKLLFDNFLLGEVTDYDTLKALPHMLCDEGVIFGKVFFYGGLCALIGFDDADSTTSFLENKGCWGKWFKWLKKRDSTLYWKHERMVDMKIIGLPNDKRRKVLKLNRTRSCPPVTDSVTNSISIDLNRDIPQAQTDLGDTTSNNESRASHEIRKTVEVGAELGFEIVADNQILHEVLAGAGVNFIA
ncbi:hypothetical protein L1887_16153 [Cichorium endivia]|nr:hypothetical protein L1887_16153 [Cichorium endivia]